MKVINKAATAIFISALSSLSSQAATVALDVSPLAGGGVIINGNGSINFSAFNQNAMLYFERTVGSQSFFSSSRFEEFIVYDTSTSLSLVIESLIISDASYDFTGLPSLDSGASIDLGTNGAGFELRGIAAHSNNFLNLVGGIAQGDGAITTGVQNYDFTILDVDGDIRGYVDGHVLFDSNGDSAGGEQIVINVIPEPTSLFLIGIGGLALINNRRRL